MSDEQPDDGDQIFSEITDALPSREMEINAFLTEWVVENTKRVGAFAIVLGEWMTVMVNTAGYSRDAVEGTLPMMIDRLWPFEKSVSFTSGEEEDDGSDD